MELNADELTEARRVIARALEEDLRYGPDVTTLATVPAEATTTAAAVAVAALVRTESRGCHHRSDFPETDPALARSLVPAVACC